MIVCLVLLVVTVAGHQLWLADAALCRQLTRPQRGGILEPRVSVLA